MWESRPTSKNLHGGTTNKNSSSWESLTSKPWVHSNQKIFQQINTRKIPGESDMGVSKNRGTPKSSILIGVSIINHPLWGWVSNIRYIEPACWTVFHCRDGLAKSAHFSGPPDGRKPCWSMPAAVPSPKNRAPFCVESWESNLKSWESNLKIHGNPTSKSMGIQPQIILKLIHKKCGLGTSVHMAFKRRSVSVSI